MQQGNFFPNVSFRMFHFTCTYRMAGQTSQPHIQWVFKYVVYCSCINHTFFIKKTSKFVSFLAFAAVKFRSPYFWIWYHVTGWLVLEVSWQYIGLIFNILCSDWTFQTLMIKQLCDFKTLGISHQAVQRHISGEQRHQGQQVSLVIMFH